MEGLKPPSPPWGDATAFKSKLLLWNDSKITNFSHWKNGTVMKTLNLPFDFTYLNKFCKVSLKLLLQRWKLRNGLLTVCKFQDFCIPQILREINFSFFHTVTHTWKNISWKCNLVQNRLISRKFGKCTNVHVQWLRTSFRS